MIQFYAEIRWVHIATVGASGILFFTRAVAAIAGARWPRTQPIRYLAYATDITLLTAGLMLLSILNLNPFTQPWLAVKLLLLVVYIVLGFMALRVQRKARRLGYTLAAMLVFLLVVSIARAHHPLGIFRALVQ